MIIIIIIIIINRDNTKGMVLFRDFVNSGDINAFNIEAETFLDYGHLITHVQRTWNIVTKAIPVITQDVRLLMKILHLL